MNSLELRHLENLCHRLGIDTYEIDQTLTYQENKHIILERFGIYDQKHNAHMTGHIERLQDLAEDWRGSPDELMTEPIPQESLNGFDAEIIETSPIIGTATTIQPSGPFADVQTTIPVEPALTREQQGPFADWQTIFRTPKRPPQIIRIIPKSEAYAQWEQVFHVPQERTYAIESIGIGPIRIDITPNGEMRARLDLLRPFKEHFAVKEKIRLWC